MANYCSTEGCTNTVDDDELYCDECIGDAADTWMCPCCDYQNEEEDYVCQGEGCNCTRPARPW